MFFSSKQFMSIVARGNHVVPLSSAFKSCDPLRRKQAMQVMYICCFSVWMPTTRES